MSSSTFNLGFDQFTSTFTSTPVYPATYTTPMPTNNQINDVGLKILSNVESPKTRKREPLIPLTGLPTLHEVLSDMSKSLKLEERTNAQNLNAPPQVEEHRGNEEKRPNKKARIAALDFQEGLLPQSSQRIGKSTQDFFIRIVPNLESIVALKRRKLEIKKSCIDEKINSDYERLKEQIDREEEIVVNLMLNNLFCKDAPYLLGGIKMFHALGIMNLKTRRLLRVWNKFPAHNCIDVLKSTHPALSLYFKGVERSQYQEYWTSLKHKERQNFVSHLKELNETWKVKIRVKGLRKAHRTKRLINSYLMSKLIEVENDEKALKVFFNKKLFQDDQKIEVH